jgi:hypothetical protein
MGPLMKKLQYTSKENGTQRRVVALHRFTEIFFFFFFFLLVSDMLLARNMTPKIAVELEERINKAGYVHQCLDIKRLTLNHTDKAGELLW